MAENTGLEIVFSIIDLLKGAFLLSLPVFLFVFVAVLVRKALEKKYKWNWFKSSIMTTFFLVFSLVFVLYVTPASSVFLSGTQPPILTSLAPTLAQTIGSLFVQFVRLIVVSILLTFLLMPVEFVGLFLFEQVSQKLKIAYSIRLFITVFLATLVCSVFLIFVMPWIIPGILFLIFFGFE